MGGARRLWVTDFASSSYSRFYKLSNVSKPSEIHIIVSLCTQQHVWRWCVRSRVWWQEDAQRQQILHVLVALWDHEAAASLQRMLHMKFVLCVLSIKAQPANHDWVYPINTKEFGSWPSFNGWTGEATKIFQAHGHLLHMHTETHGLSSGCTIHLPAAASHFALRQHWHIYRGGRWEGPLEAPGVWSKVFWLRPRRLKTLLQVCFCEVWTSRRMRWRFSDGTTSTPRPPCLCLWCKSSSSIQPIKSVTWPKSWWFRHFISTCVFQLLHVLSLTFRFSAEISLIWKVTCKFWNLCNDVIRTHQSIVSWFVLQSKYRTCRVPSLASSYFLFLLLVNGGVMLGRGCRCVR